MTVTAILSIKVCPCGARAPICWPMDHAPDCESNFCTVERGPWPIDDDDEVVVIVPQVIE